MHYMKYLAAAVACVIIYIFGYTLELHSNSLENALFWNGIQYLVIPIISTLWLITALLYVGLIKRTNSWVIKSLFVIPIITYVLRYTNHFHFLYYTGYTFEICGELGILKLEKNIWYYVQQLYECAEMFVVIMIFWIYSFKENVGERYRYRLLSLISAGSSISLILILLDPKGWGLDYTAILFPIILFTLSYFISKQDFFEISSMARNQFFDQSNEAMLILSDKNRIVDYNFKAIEFFERNGINLTNAELNMFHDKNRPLIEALGSQQVEQYQEKIDGDFRYWEITSNMIMGKREKRCGVIKTIRDITKDYVEKENLEKMSKVDELTQLYNRREFNDYASKLLKESEERDISLVMLMFDIDYFKLINDTFGHQIGDRVIQRIAKEASVVFREDDFIARIGGEEFVVVLKDITESEAQLLANQYRQIIEHLRIIPSDPSYQFTISMGMAVYSKGMSLEVLINHADKALYKAKNLGRNRVVKYV